MAPRVLIIGFGLMGGSAGLALRARGWHVRYVDHFVPFTGIARDAADERLEQPVASELTLLATHLDEAVTRLATLPQGGVITSLCSLMRPLRDVGRADFVAGHPMAGSHRSGIQFAQAELYRGRPWFLDGRNPLVEQMVADLGAELRFTTAAEHDEAMALTSQLPQLLSTTLAAYLGSQSDLEKVLAYAGPGLRDFLRLAGSNADMWRSIFEHNRETLVPHVDALVTLLRELVSGDPTNGFARANEVFEQLQTKREV